MKKQDHKFIEKGLVISFWAMLISWAIFVALMISEGEISIHALIAIPLIVIIIISPVFNFVVSIIHLNKVKEKAFAVISLIMSTIITFLLALLLIFFILGTIYV